MAVYREELVDMQDEGLGGGGGDGVAAVLGRRTNALDH